MINMNQTTVQHRKLHRDAIKKKLIEAGEQQQQQQQQQKYNTEKSRYERPMKNAQHRAKHNPLLNYNQLYIVIM